MSPQFSARIRATAGLVLAGLIASVVFHGCEGSGTQTTTGKGVEGSLVDHHGRPINGATIKILPIHYGANRIGDAEDSSGVIAVTTDQNGRYFISDLEVGVYNLIGTDAERKSAVLIPKVKYIEQALDLGIGEAVAAVIAPPGRIVLEKLHISPALRAFHFIYRIFFPVLGILSRTFHVMVLLI